MSSRLRVIIIGYFVAATCAVASTKAPLSSLSPKELAQGFRNEVVLAKPRANALASVDRDEARDGTRVRNRFARFGHLRIIEVPADETVAHAVARLQATGRYEFVEPDYIRHVDATVPNDPYFGSQWAMRNTAQVSGYTAGADISATGAWDVIHDASNVVVALIDSGVRIDHLDLAGNLWTNPSPTFGDVHGASFVDGVRGTDLSDGLGHGTHVAGIICATGNNGSGIAGVVWRTQLMVLKNGDASGYSLESDTVSCVDYAVAHGASVINCSFGGTHFSQTEYTAFKAARDAGVIVVCSAGNDGLSNDTNPHYPSNYLLDNIIAVGNSTPTDAPSDSSDYGVLVDLFAPGTSILSLDYSTTSGVVSLTGTSMAAPHVTGAIALLKARYPTDTYRQLINRVLNGVDIKVALAGYATTNGRLNLLGALNASNTPFNDNFSKFAIVGGSTITLRANNIGATLETAAGEPAHVGGASGSLWWAWYEPKTGQVVIDTTGSEVDTVLDVYTTSTLTTAAAKLTTLVPEASNDDDGAAKTSRVSFTVAGGSWYFIAVSSKNNQQGYIQVNISTPPINDNFANAAVLTGDSSRATVNNISATAETGEPSILKYAPAASVWYKWTASRSGQFQVSAFSYDFDTVLAVYTGTALDHLTLVTANDDTDPSANLYNLDSRCTFNATAGTTYYFQADTTIPSIRGSLTLTITDSLWQLSTGGGSITSAPSVGADGTVYVASELPDDELYAVAPDGTLKWAYPLAGSASVASCAIGSDGTIYQGCDAGTIYALTPSGALKWKKDLGTGNDVSVSITLAADGTLYTHGDDGYFYALDPADGSIKWQYKVDATTYASAAVAPDGTIYQGSDIDQCLYALNPDGTLKWKYPTGGTTYAAPAIDAAGNIYFGIYSNSNVISLTPSGTLRWTYTGVAQSYTNAVSSSPALSADGKTVYIGAGDNGLHAIDATTGLGKWIHPCGDWILASSPAVDRNGVIYVGDYDGKLYAINPADGWLKRTWDTGAKIRSSPTISGTTLYVGSNDGKLYAFDIGAGVAEGPWPQYRQNRRHLGRVIADALAFTVLPQAHTLKVGEAATLTVAAVGQDPITFQWYKDGVAITGATGTSYTISNATTASAGSYTVTIASPQGTLTSAAARIDIDAGNPNPNPSEPAAWLSNLSVRTTMTAGQLLTVGLYVNGGAESILVRGAGPALENYGVTTAMADPRLELFQNGASIYTNDNWDYSLKDVFNSVGAFPFDQNSKDAAFVQSLSGSYTIQVTGTGAGTILVEGYALGSGSAERLSNISARNISGAGDGILTAGFYISGSGKKRLLIRGVGPTLANWGVNDYLVDPLLEVHASQDHGSGLLAQNDTWDASLADTFTSVSAFPLNAGSKDAATIVELDAGAGYTVQVKGADGGTGEALVEVYELP